MNARLPVLPSGSELPRALRCPGSCVLPQVRTEPGQPAAQGNAVHTYLELIHAGMAPADALLRVPEEYRDVCACIQLDALPTRMLDMAVIHAEMTLAYNVATRKVRYLGSGMRRDYSKADRTVEIVLTVDVCGMEKTGQLWVWDWKTGWGADRVEPAEHNPQLWAGGLCWARAQDKGAVTVGPVGITERGFIDATSTHTLDGMDMDAFEAQLGGMVDEVRRQDERAGAGRGVDVKEGHWCSGCPAFKACPAKRGLLFSAAQDADAVMAHLRTRLEAESDRHVAHQVWRDLVTLADKAEAEVKADALAHGPIGLGNGLAFGEQEVGTAGKKRFAVYRAEKRKAAS